MGLAIGTSLFRGSVATQAHKMLIAKEETGIEKLIRVIQDSLFYTGSSQQITACLGKITDKTRIDSPEFQSLMKAVAKRANYSPEEIKTARLVRAFLVSQNKSQLVKAIDQRYPLGFFAKHQSKVLLGAVAGGICAAATYALQGNLPGVKPEDFVQFPKAPIRINMTPSFLLGNLLRVASLVGMVFGLEGIGALRGINQAQGVLIGRLRQYTFLDRFKKEEPTSTEQYSSLSKIKDQPVSVRDGQQEGQISKQKLSMIREGNHTSNEKDGANFFLKQFVAVMTFFTIFSRIGCGDRVYETQEQMEKQLLSVVIGEFMWGLLIVGCWNWVRASYLRSPGREGLVPSIDTLDKLESTLFFSWVGINLGSLTLNLASFLKGDNAIHPGMRSAVDSSMESAFDYLLSIELIQKYVSMRLSWQIVSS